MWLVLSGEIEVVRRDGLNHETAITRCAPASSAARSASSPGAGRWPPAGRARPAAPPALRPAHVRAPWSARRSREALMRAFICGAWGSSRGAQAGADRPAQRADWCGCRASRATAIPAPCSMPPPTRRARRRGGLGVQARSCRDALSNGTCSNAHRRRRLACASASPRARSADGVRRVVVVGAGPAGLATAVYLPLPRASPCWCSTSARSADRPALPPHREHLGFSHRHLGHGAGRARVQPGAEVRPELAIPLEVARLDLQRSRARPGAPLRVELTDGRTVQAAHRGRCVRGALSPPGDPELGDLRGQRHLLLGVAGRGEALRGRGGRAGRRRQFGRARRRVPCAQVERPAPDRARERAGGDHVALSSSTASRAAERRAACRHPRWSPWTAMRRTA